MKGKLIITTSWDDGHKLDLRLARLLRKYGIRGTFYISPWNREFKEVDLLTDKDVNRISSDFEIGAHTMTHPRLTTMDNHKVSKEITDSKKYLENVVGNKIHCFCYPGGAFNRDTKRLVKEAGFAGARTIEQMITRPSGDYHMLGTTIHISPLSPISRLGEIRFALKNNKKFIPLIFSGNWQEVTKKIFDHFIEVGQVWHLWGHSWIIDQFKLWDELEMVLDYISERNDMKYLTNYEMICELKKDQ